MRFAYIEKQHVSSAKQPLRLLRPDMRDIGLGFPQHGLDSLHRISLPLETRRRAELHFYLTLDI